jgi:outer membrane protein TolC
VGFALGLVDKINSELDEGKLLKDLMGPQVACLVTSFVDISNVIPTLSLNFPDLVGMLKNKLQEIQNAMTAAIDGLLQPLRNLITSLADALQQVNDLIAKIAACASAT